MKRLDGKHASAACLMFVLSLGILGLWGCPKKTEVTSTPEVQREEAPPTPPVAAPAAPSQPEPAEKAKPKDQEVKEKSAAEVPGLQPAYFDFDRSVIRPEDREILQANAEWLKAHPKVKIKIEGNCDERGTREYNQALGQRRAANAKKFLTHLGISATRISLISYGKEKPGCTESTESCWQENRRDDFSAVAD